MPPPDLECSNNKKAVILLSGGLDSAVSAHLLHKQNVELHALTFISSDFQGINSSEAKCAMIIASQLGIKHKIVDLSCLSGLCQNSSNMKLSIKKVTHRHEKVIPFGIEIMLTASVMYAAGHGIKRIIWSIQLDDLGDGKTPQDIKSYLDIFGRLITFRNKTRYEIETPLLTMRKLEIVALGKELGVPFHNTFSCLRDRGDLIHCRECEQCIQRSNALAIVNTESKI